MVEKLQKIWVDGELVAWDDAQVHILTHSLHYGLGAFEGIRAYKRANGKSYVGHYGATVFASALHRVAVVNNIPVKAWSWCHGSISTRMAYVRGLSSDPALTCRFDRFMRWVYVTLVVLLLVAGLFAVRDMLQG